MTSTNSQKKVWENMANTLTVKTGFTSGVTSRSSGFAPCIAKTFDMVKLPMAANAQVVAFKVPKGSILKRIIVDVKKVGSAGTLAVGTHVGGLSDSGITTAPTTYTDAAPVDMEVLGKTLFSPTAAIVAADHFVVVKPSAAQAAAVIEITAIVDVFDVSVCAD